MKLLLLKLVNWNIILFAISEPLFYWVKSVSPKIFEFSKKHLLNIIPSSPIFIDID